MESPNKIRIVDKRIVANDLIPIENSAYDLPDFEKIKSELNATKSKIDDFHLNKETADRYYNFSNKIRITNQLRQFINSKCNGQHVTRAWIKFYEIHAHYETIPRDIRQLKVFFNAELPGASICALNHYMKTMRPRTEFNWKASSYADVKDLARQNSREYLGDHYCIYEKNPSNWMMNENNNGDMTKLDNLLDIEKRLGSASADLYTHDAGVGLDDTTNFNIQERVNAHIHLGCALMGFMTLKKGGVFIAKQYTFFESFSVSLLLIYASMFDNFYITKPMTSGQSNSEIYLIGKGFRGFPDAYRIPLLAKLKNFDFTPVVSSKVLLAHPAYNDLLSISRDIFQQQIAFINTSINLFEKIIHDSNKENEILREYRNMGIQFSKDWTRKYTIKKINANDYIKSC